LNWKLKSAILRACDGLPVGRESSYYAMQRGFGRLRSGPDLFSMLSECASLMSWLQAERIKVEGTRFLEIGTGRSLDMPIGFYLAGAASTVTIDLNPYLKPSLVLQSLSAMRQKKDHVAKIFRSLVDPDTLNRRMNALFDVSSFPQLMELAHIEYQAPADAAHMQLPDRGIDIHTSFTVFEHVLAPALVGILMESNRLLSDEGVAIHHIDPSDHFSHGDRNISAINFLQFSESQWKKYGGNRFAYHNRLRASDYERIYGECGHNILRLQTEVDERSMDMLKDNFRLDQKFVGLAPRTICTTALRVLSRPARSH
jgi:hypothetical protein